MKIVGIIIILISSSLLGIYFADRLKKRLKELSDIKCMLEQISVLIRYKVLTVYEIIDELKDNDICRRLPFINNFNKIKDESFYNQWCKSIDTSDTSLKDEDKKVLKSFGSFFGSSDVDGQLADIKVFAENIDNITVKAKEDYEKKSKLYKSLGVVAGAFISIMLM